MDTYRDFTDIVSEWTGSDIPLPQVTLQYTIGSCGTLPACWTMNWGAQGDCGLVIEDSEVRFELYFAADITADQRQRAINFFEERLGMAI